MFSGRGYRPPFLPPPSSGELPGLRDLPGRCVGGSSPCGGQRAPHLSRPPARRRRFVRPGRAGLGRGGGGQRAPEDPAWAAAFPRLPQQRAAAGTRGSGSRTGPRCAAGAGPGPGQGTRIPTAPGEPPAGSGENRTRQPDTRPARTKGAGGPGKRKRGAQTSAGRCPAGAAPSPQTRRFPGPGATHRPAGGAGPGQPGAEVGAGSSEVSRGRGRHLSYAALGSAGAFCCDRARPTADPPRPAPARRSQCGPRSAPRRAPTGCH